MYYAWPLFMGFVAASVGIMPPGLLNMTAVKVSMKEGRNRALVFAAGATLVLVFQAWLAVVFARYLNRNPNVILTLREVGLAVFTLLAVYFLFMAAPPTLKEKKIKFRSKRYRFFMGMLLSGLNFFTIPFYVFVSITLSSYHIFVFENPLSSLFILGIAMGTFFGFYCFVVFFQKMQHRTTFILKNMNRIIGGVLLLVSLLTLINVVNHYR